MGQHRPFTSIWQLRHMDINMAVRPMDINMASVLGTECKHSHGSQASPRPGAATWTTDSNMDSGSHTTPPILLGNKHVPLLTSALSHTTALIFWVSSSSSLHRAYTALFFCLSHLSSHICSLWGQGCLAHIFSYFVVIFFSFLLILLNTKSFIYFDSFVLSSSCMS